MKTVLLAITLASMLLALASLPVFAAPISFPECPAVGHDTSGCELLITVTAVDTSGTPSHGNATAFSVATSSPDLGPFDGSNDTLIGVLNLAPVAVSRVIFTVAPGTGTFAFDTDGACLGTGGVSHYSPGPTAMQCLQGQYQTADAFDYASTGVTFCSFNLAAACVIVGEPSGILAPGASAWFSLPALSPPARLLWSRPSRPRWF